MEVNAGCKQQRQLFGKRKKLVDIVQINNNGSSSGSCSAQTNDSTRGYSSRERSSSSNSGVRRQVVFSYLRTKLQVWKNLSNSRRGRTRGQQTKIITAIEKHRTQLTATSWLESEGHGADVERPGAELTFLGPLEDYPPAGAGVALADRKIDLASKALSPQLAGAAVALPYSGIGH